MRIVFDKRTKNDNGYVNQALLRFFMQRKQFHEEFAYIVFGLRAPSFYIEFPSDWHESARVWIVFSLFFFSLSFSFPWKWVVPDHFQCSGPRYGFQFYEDMLWIYYGKSKGTRDDPTITIWMPWSWKHIEHVITSEESSHPYTYIRKNGTIQNRIATIYSERREYRRFWFPRKKIVESINVQFDDEVGERTGSWKGGVIGCGYDLKKNESPLECLRRMEKERKFD